MNLEEYHKQRRSILKNERYSPALKKWAIEQLYKTYKESKYEQARAVKEGSGEIENEN